MFDRKCDFFLMKKGKTAENFQKKMPNTAGQCRQSSIDEMKFTLLISLL